MLVKGVVVLSHNMTSFDRSLYYTSRFKLYWVEIIWLRFLLFKRAAESMMKVNFIDPLPPKLREDTAKTSAAYLSK